MGKEWFAVEVIFPDGKTELHAVPGRWQAKELHDHFALCGHCVHLWEL